MDRMKRVRATHECGKDLSLTDKWYLADLKKFTTEELQRDLAVKGDITSLLLIPKSMEICAAVIMKEDGIIAGIREAKWFLEKEKIRFKPAVNDGQMIRKGTCAAFISGNAQAILACERTLLNLLQRMSGVATSAAEFVKIAGNKVLVTPTRKTQWGLLDKRACVLGGAGTHRLSLGDAVLIKDNHLAITGMKPEFIFGTLIKAKSPGRFVEIETKSLKEAMSVMDGYKKFGALFKVPFYVMFDNMQPSDIKKGIEYGKRNSIGEIFFEASGGINKGNIARYVKTGVDVISAGAITHSSRAPDISLEIM